MDPYDEPHLPRLSGAAGRRVAFTAVCLVLLLFGCWGLWRVFAPDPVDARGQIAERDHRLAQQQDLINELQQRVATLRTSDQISRDANRELQNTLAERDEEIASLRADVDFYERFVCAIAQPRNQRCAAWPCTSWSWNAAPARPGTSPPR